MSEDWSREEVEAIVADYIAMLEEELRGRTLNKAEHNKNLRKVLRKRSRPSVEFKHRNISAVLFDLGFPRYIEGYKPLSNYQDLLFEVVADRLRTANVLHELLGAWQSEPGAPPRIDDILDRLVAPPKKQLRKVTRLSGPVDAYRTAPRRGSVDYFARDARNAGLGLAGETFVLQYERARLRAGGRENLADRIEHVSQDVGAAAGFDIKSYETNGRDRLIEVKTTRYAIEAPFYVTANELAVSRECNDQYHLYRVFQFSEDPRLFSLRGPIDKVCSLLPVEYRGVVA